MPYVTPSTCWPELPRRWAALGPFMLGCRPARPAGGRKLTEDDLEHYRKVVVALRETIRLMREIDECIPSWPIG